MNEIIRNMLLQGFIPFLLAIYCKSYKKSSRDYTIPEKGGFRTEYSLKDIYNWRKTNNIAYKVTYFVILTQIIAFLISMSLQIIIKINPVKLYVYTIGYMMLSHIVSVAYIQYKSKK